MTLSKMHFDAFSIPLLVRRGTRVLKGGMIMETKYYIVARIEGDYAWLNRTDAEEEPLFIARALLPEAIDEGTKLKYEILQYEVRIELMNRLKAAAFKLLTVEDNCERFAIIDREIIWYGSMNLLSKADVEDNLMRVVSKDIATELLELTFCGAKNLKLSGRPF